MSVNKYMHRVLSCVYATAFTLSFAPNVAAIDSRLAVGPLPEPLINTRCFNVDYTGWGWDGEQSCFPTDLRLYGAALPLSQTRNDFGGDATAWGTEDVANKTIRCDIYKRPYGRSAEEYQRSRYDITFLTEDTIPSDAMDENLSDVTAHLYTRGWEIRSFGRLETELLIDFNGRAFGTEKGYIFIEDTDSVNSSDERLVRKFSHCYYRDEDTVFRAGAYCIDYDGDGVGVNNGAVCEVKPIDSNCDYSQADMGYNSGWGYNAVTGESCPPTGNSSGYVPDNTCKYIRSNGWGWNEALQQSCRADE